MPSYLALSFKGRDLRGLTDDQLLERYSKAKRSATSALENGMGRNPKAARAWRAARDETAEEIDRRGLRLT